MTFCTNATTCDMPFCEAKSAVSCSQCNKRFCASCILPELKIYNDGNSVGYCCPLCREDNIVEENMDNFTKGKHSCMKHLLVGGNTLAVLVPCSCKPQNECPQMLLRLINDRRIKRIKSVHKAGIEKCVFRRKGHAYLCKMS